MKTLITKDKISWWKINSTIEESEILQFEEYDSNYRHYRIRPSKVIEGKFALELSMSTAHSRGDIIIGDLFDSIEEAKQHVDAIDQDKLPKATLERLKQKMKPVPRIVTHDKGAHVDDFLASCLLLYKTDAPLYRQPATDEDLADGDVWVIDQGRCFNPELLNFDHHQIDTERCAATMVLDYFTQEVDGAGENYRELFPYWKFIEQADSRGPFVAGKLFGDEQGKYVEYTKSPIIGGLLKRFSACEGLVTDYPLLKIMKDIGGGIFDEIYEMEGLLNEITTHHKILEHAGLTILDVSDSDCEKQLPTKEWSKLNNIDPQIILAKNYRGNGGFRMVRTNDQAIKFNSDHPSVTFAHITGFLVCFDGRENFKEIIDASKS